jgi:hypothetical protein
VWTLYVSTRSGVELSVDSPLPNRVDDACAVAAVFPSSG